MTVASSRAPDRSCPSPLPSIEREPVVGALVRSGAEQHQVLDTEPHEQRVAVGHREQPSLHLVEVVDHAVDLADRREHITLDDLDDVVRTAIELDLRPGFDEAGCPVRV